MNNMQNVMHETRKVGVATKTILSILTFGGGGFLLYATGYALLQGDMAGVLIGLICAPPWIVGFWLELKAAFRRRNQ